MLSPSSATPAASQSPTGELARAARPTGGNQEARSQEGSRSWAEAREPGAAEGAEKRGLRVLLRRHPYLALLAVILLVGVLAAGSIWWLQARQYESTDDAFIDTRTVAISSQVNGAIIDLPVTDNQLVAAGAVLARIDQRDYRAALNQAQAQVEQAQAGIANLEAQIAEQQARIEQAGKEAAQAQAALTFARQQDSRAQELLQKGAGTRQSAQRASSDLLQAEASYAAAEANLAVNHKQIGVLKTQREVAAGQLDQAQAAREQADANLARTIITAPTAGRVTKLTAAKGSYAQIGQSLMMFVPREVWVTANFKETQLASMRPGQKVDIHIDAYPGRTFRGHVDSIQAGSGAAFSLLPPENATGNYVKVVQRVPVKIVFDEHLDVYVGPGMSVVPDVKVQ